MSLPLPAKARRFIVTSLGGGTEPAVLAASLARALAKAGRRTVIVDLARAGSWLERLCSVIPGAGISELVTGHTDFTKVIGRDSLSTVHLLRYGIDRSPASFAAIEARIDPLLAALASSYDTVIVHVGEATLETANLMSRCEAAILLAPSERSTDAAAAAHSLQAAGLAAVQTILVEPELDAAAA
jgi:Mrp family chromosome partitioning ATPase